MGGYEVGAADGSDTEEEEDEDVAKAAVAVGVAAECVTDGGPDGGGAQQKETDGFGAQEGAEGEPDHYGAGEAAQDGEDDDGGAEVRGGEGAALEAVGGAGAFVGVGAAEVVAKFVRQVGKDLEEGGGDGGSDGVVVRGESESEDDASQGEGEGAQTH